MSCDRCATQLEENALWCDACGLWSGTDRAVCEGPELQQAMGVCVVCGTPVCEGCVQEKDGRMYCADVTHPSLYGSHVVLERYASVFEADWVCKNLGVAGITSHVFPYRSRPGLYGLALPYEAAVFVQREDVPRCKEVLDKYAETKGS